MNGLPIMGKHLYINSNEQADNWHEAWAKHAIAICGYGYLLNFFLTIRNNPTNAKVQDAIYLNKRKNKRTSSTFNLQL